MKRSAILVRLLLSLFRRATAAEKWARTLIVQNGQLRRFLADANEDLDTLETALVMTTEELERAQKTVKAIGGNRNELLQNIDDLKARLENLRGAVKLWEKRARDLGYKQPRFVTDLQNPERPMTATEVSERQTLEERGRAEARSITGRKLKRITFNAGPWPTDETPREWRAHEKYHAGEFDSRIVSMQWAVWAPYPEGYEMYGQFTTYRSGVFLTKEGFLNWQKKEHGRVFDPNQVREWPLQPVFDDAGALHVDRQMIQDLNPPQPTNDDDSSAD